MDAEIKQQRSMKMNASLNAATDHMTRVIAALRDCNLYSNPKQEKVFDNWIFLLNTTKTQMIDYDIEEDMDYDPTQLEPKPKHKSENDRFTPFPGDGPVSR